MVDLNLNFVANAASAISGVKSLSAATIEAREQFKRAFFEEQSRARQAQISIKELIVAEKQRRYELKQTESNLISLKRSEESLARARNQANLAQQRLNLKIAEQNETGVSGLDRYIQMLTGYLPPGLNQAATLFSEFSGTATVGIGGMTAATVALTAVISVGLVAAIAAAAFAFKEFTRQFQTQIGVEQQQIGAVTAIANAANLSRQQSRELVSSFRSDLNRLSEGFVNVADSARIGNIVIDDFAKGALESGRSLKEAQLQAAKFSTNLAFYAKAENLDPGQLSNVLGDIVTGDISIQQLRGRDVLQGFNKVLIPLLAEAGVREGKLLQLTLQQRLDILTSASEKFNNEEIRAELEKTVGGQITLFQNSLFNPDTGILSITRKLSDGKSLYDEVAKTIKLFIGKDGLLENIATIFGVPNFDLIESLRDNVRKFNEFLEALNVLLKAIADLRELLNKFANSVKSTISNVIPDPVEQAGSSFIGQSALRGVSNIDLLPGGLIDVGTVLGLFGIKAQPKFRGESEFAPMMNVLEAIKVENENKPPGSNIVIANSSETVLTREQAKSYSGGLSIGNITINQLPGESSEQLVNRLIAEMGRRLRAELELLS